MIVTAPGRQGAAAPELTAALADATSLPVRVLTAESEGRLAYDGAVARAVGDLPEVVAVVDVGGGSTEVVVGTPLLGAAWVRSADVGSLRLTRAHLTDDPPLGRPDPGRADAVGRALAGMSPPRPALALAVGGSARALTKIVGRRFDADDLERAVEDPLPPSGREGGAPVRHRARARRDPARRRPAPRRREPRARHGVRARERWAARGCRARACGCAGRGAGRVATPGEAEASPQR